MYVGVYLPAIASQVVVVWILSSSDGEEVTKAVVDASHAVVASLKALGVIVKLDDRDNYLPGWKYAHWEQKVRGSYACPHCTALQAMQAMHCATPHALACCGCPVPSFSVLLFLPLCVGLLLLFLWWRRRWWRRFG